MRAVVAVLALALVSCATTTKIVSDPPGATVTNLDDKKPLGKTPLTWESKMWIWQSEHFEVKAPHHQTRVIELKRTEPDALPIVAAACLTLTCCGAVGGVPLFLAGGLKLPATVKVTLPADKRHAVVGEAGGGDDDVVCMRY